MLSSTGLLDLGVGLLIWMGLVAFICLWKQNNGLIDGFWGLGFVAVSAATFHQLQSNGAYPESFSIILLLNALVWIWAFRLSGYLFYRNWGKPEDFRYANWRKDWGPGFWNQAGRSFLKVYLLQGVILLVVSIPIWWSNLGPRELMLESTVANRVLAILFAAISLSGIFLQAIADWQKYEFKMNPANRGKILNQGLWKYSRHPNYLGEILMWWGIGGLSCLYTNGWVGLIGSSFITFLLLKVSGVPLLEEKYKTNPLYQEYMKSTGRILPKLF